MGSASSKAATRRLPKQPSWAGARSDVLASESKTKAIQQDAKDPQLFANLSKLGPVNVPNLVSTLQPSDAIFKSMKVRQASEDIASSPTPVQNRLLVQSCIDLLDQRKTAASPLELDQIAKKYGIDIHVLEKLTKHINSPSTGETIESRNVNAQGQRALLSKAVWIDPTLLPDTASTSHVP